MVTDGERDSIRAAMARLMGRELPNFDVPLINLVDGRCMAGNYSRNGREVSSMDLPSRAPVPTPAEEQVTVPAAGGDAAEEGAPEGVGYGH
jgi:hypothetical protein